MTFSSRLHTLSDVLVARARGAADQPVFVQHGRVLTYGTLLDDARGLASGLLAAGVREGDCVVLLMAAGLDFARAFWAVQLLGAVSCALNPQAPAATSIRRAKRVRPALILTDSEPVAREAVASGVRCLTLDEVPRTAAKIPRHGRTPEDIALLQPTSGTSGEPRAAMIRHRNLLFSLSGSAAALGYGPHDVFVAWVPPWHDLGLIRFMVGTVYFGARTYIVQPSIQTIPEWLQTIARERGTVTGAPDFAWRLAARFSEPGSIDLSSLRNATNGGEPVRWSTVTSFEKTFGIRGVMLPGYGLAEATLGVTCHLPGEPVQTDANGNVSCGPPLPGVEVKIAAESGEVLVSGEVVFAGYFESEEATRETLRDGWLYTGDVGYLDENSHLFVLGRKRAMLKRGGAVLAPRELEEAAQQVEGVRIAAAVALSVHDATEQIVVVLEVDGDEEGIRREVGEAIRSCLGFLPDRLLIVDKGAIPRTYNGKIRHDALREALAAGTLTSSE